jgi:Niemann-Pick C1 protein
MKFAVVFLTLLCLWGRVTSKCVMRGYCAEVGGFSKHCLFNEEAPPLIDDTDPEEFDEILDMLKLRCPSLTVDENGKDLPHSEIRTCCDAPSIRYMATNLLLSDGILGRCPTCSQNFVRQICEMNCSPDQDRFVNVYDEQGPDNVSYVNEIDYRMYAEFMEAAHESCSGVMVPQTGLPAINLMCGNAPVCTDEAWFGFTGDAANNPMVPVQVNFIKTYTKEDSMHVRAPPCNETSEGEYPCSCVDCRASCPIGNEPVLVGRCKVFLSVDCVAFGISLGVFVIIVAIFTILTVFQYRKVEKEKPLGRSTKNGNILQRFFQKTFARIGASSANHPVVVLMLCSWLCVAMLFGVLQLRITSSPLELWSLPESRSRAELNYFNSRFGPFYRAAQVFLKINLDPFVANNITYGPAFRLEAIQELIELEDSIIDIGRDDNGVPLEQVCYAPLRMPGAEKKLDECVSMSIASYLLSSRYELHNQTYLSAIQNCLNNHYGFECIAPWGGSADPEVVLGGYDNDDMLSANTLLINFPINNYVLEADLVPVLEFEGRFIEVLKDYIANKKPDYIDVAFGTERSVEDELIRVSVAEIVPIMISYILMFVYVTLALGHIRSLRTWFIDSKIMVAVGSILVVIAAVFCSCGVMGYTDVTLTLLAINVIPFFVLSVGIDNVFLMINTLHDINSNLKQFDDYNENFDFQQKREFVFYKMMGVVGPSMFVSSVTQITCFAIGSLANFPAVQTFSIFAAISLGFLFLFQITLVVSMISVDYQRASQNRFDVLCCIQKKILDDTDPLNSDTPYQSLSSRFMGPYSKFIIKWRVKIVVVIIFMLTTSLSGILIPKVEVGLDQELSLPVDSYVYDYLLAVNNLLRIGPPVYFVLKSGLNFTDMDHQNAVCGGRLCNDTSLITQIFLAAQYSNVTYMARSSNSWLDDFIDWTSLPGSCCKYNLTDGSFCPSSDTSSECAFCEIERDEWAGGLRPGREAIEKYLPFFVQDAPSNECSKGGLASYFTSVNYVLDSEGRATIRDTSFMAYHTPLSNSYDYITALKYGYEIAENITVAIKELTGQDVEVFAYSVFYVFYEQYMTMWPDTLSSIGYCLIGALVFNLMASGFNFLTTFAVMFTAVMIVVHMMGVMYLWSIPLNAVSCVNLIVCIGIGVEFCTHIAYASAVSPQHGSAKVVDAMKRVGPTIITGITLTNIPIIVLAFSYTEIIEVFFFRMFFSLVLIGFAHGMVFFPVLLSYLYNIFPN